jgi:hypothetical protein
VFRGVTPGVTTGPYVSQFLWKDRNPGGGPEDQKIQKAAQVLKPFTKGSCGRRDVDSFTAQTTLPFNDFWPLYIEKKVLEASEHGQKAAWHKKWNVHRRLRPEEYAGRVQATKGDGFLVPTIELSY